MESTLKNKFMAAKLSDIPPKSGRAVMVQGVELAVFHLSNGKVQALENRCPHKNGPLSEGIVSGNYVFCPLHDWKIDTCDGLVQAPDQGCVKKYEAVVEDDTIFVMI